MCNDKIIPLIYTNIDEDKLYKVERSNGTIQTCSLGENKGISINSNTNKLVIVNYFNKNDNEKVIPRMYTELYKGVDITKFLKTNNLDIKVSLPYFTEDELNIENTIIKDTMIFYNQKLLEFEKIIKTFICYE